MSARLARLTLSTALLCAGMAIAPPFCDAQSRPQRDEGRAIALTTVTVGWWASGLTLAGLGIYGLAVGPSCEQTDVTGLCVRTRTPNDDMRYAGVFSLSLSAVVLVLAGLASSWLDAEWNPGPRGTASVTPWLEVGAQGGAGGVVIRW